MFKKNVFLFLVLFFALSAFLIPSVYAEDSTDEASLISKLAELSTKKDTLSNQIKIISSQYDLTLTKITQTENSIKTLEKEIDNLTLQIGDLNQRLDELASNYIVKSVENYKLQKKVPLFAFLFSANLNDYLNQYKYVSGIQKSIQNNMINNQSEKNYLDDQKRQKAEKQQEMETLQKTLATQKNSLNNQKIAKDQLLKVTEKEYTDIQKQLAALRAFSSGGDTCLSSSPGTGNDGNFYSQRDPRWCNKFIGLSTDTIGAVGCYISSICMTYKKLGSNITPSEYASTSTNFVGNSAWMLNPSAPSGYSYKSSSYNSSTVDKELSAGRYVIAQMKMNNGVGMHFIVIISGSNGSYKIHDPWYGSDQDFSSRYSTLLIMSVRLITK